MNMQIFKTAKVLKNVRISYKNINKQLICWLLGIYIYGKRKKRLISRFLLVEYIGVEPMTSWLPAMHSSQLS